jgi:myo-inositol-1(or 4)-monophosphatase
MIKNRELELQIFLDIASEAAVSAGAILKSHVGKIENIEEKSYIGDLVTEVDKKSEQEILKIIMRHFPTHSILAEESGEIYNSQSDYLWAIDPLDGTTNYAHGYPMACVSIGLLIEGIPKIGVIYNPFKKELFRGGAGLGATLNRRPIKISGTNQLGKSLLVSGFAYDRRQTADNNYKEFCYLTHLTQGVRRSGSAALDLADVACGRLDGYWERGLSLWDIAAGALIVQEAGGIVTAYDQSPVILKSGKLLATNGLIHEQLSKALLDAKNFDTFQQNN